MQNSDYWKNRFTVLEDSLNSYGVEAYVAIEKIFIKVQKEIDLEIEKWYNRISDNNLISMVEAKKFLTTSQLEEFKWTVDEYIKYALENEINDKWVKQLENASAKYHISRLEALKINTQQAMEVAFGNELDSVDQMAKKTYTEGYYRAAFEVQKAFSIGFDIGTVDENKLAKIISKPWTADGNNFSDRIWQSKTSMVSSLHTEMTRMCVLGKSPKEAIENMSKYVDKKCKNAKSQAGRLVMTEQAFFASASQKNCYSDLDVEEFEVVATLDMDTSEICQNMDGRHFPTNEFIVGTTAPPFHPWCRSTTCPYFDDEFSQDGYRASRGDDDKTVYDVPANMKYPEWKEKFVDGGLKTDNRN